jgi:hypothetical protein
MSTVRKSTCLFADDDGVESWDPTQAGTGRTSAPLRFQSGWRIPRPEQPAHTKLPQHDMQPERFCNPPKCGATFCERSRSLQRSTRGPDGNAQSTRAAAAVVHVASTAIPRPRLPHSSLLFEGLPAPPMRRHTRSARALAGAAERPVGSRATPSLFCWTAAGLTFAAVIPARGRDHRRAGAACSGAGVW